jgi:hypothetical protein
LLGIVPLVGIATSAHGADSGSLTWGFKASWRTYVATIAAGTTSISGGAGTNGSGEYVFPQESTDLTSPDDTGVTKYEGSVRWQSSAHGFDITMSDPWLEVTSSDEAVLTAVLTDNAGNSRGRVEIATVELDDPEVEDDSLTWTDRPTVISEEAAETFTHYANAAGDPLDAVVHEEGIGVDDPDPEPTPTPTAEPTTTPTPDPAPEDPELVWGLKESFRSYITGSIAKGSVSRADGAEVRNGIYVWDQHSASVDATAQGRASYRGSIRFQGHEDAATSGTYALDLELRDPQIALASASSAVLSFHVIDRADSVTTDHGRMDFAKVSLTDSSICGSAGYRGWSGASTTITADGAKVMNNYPEGTALDRLAFAIEDPNLTASGLPACTADDDPGGGSTGGGSTPTPGSTTTPDDDDTTSKTAGKLTWGVKESFRTYIVGSIAKGRVTVSDGAKTSGDLYQWGQESTATTNGVGTTNYFGSVRFYGHAGELDMDFSDPRVDVDSSSSGSISFSIDGRRVNMVDLDLADGTRSTSGGVVRWSNVPATLTNAGADAFENRYDSGTVMDDVSFIIGSRASADSDSEEVDSHSDPDSDSSTVTPASLASAVTDAEGGAKCPLAEANLSWGFKESFRSYISGSIAKGKWNVADGASYETPSFRWTQASGNATAPTKAVVDFTGTVRFTGHSGALNTTIANPSLLIADDAATLKLDVSGASRDAAMEGKTENQDFPDIAFAAIDLSGLKRDGNTWTATSAPTTLTSSGNAAFDSYEAGTALDPVTFSVTFNDCLDEAEKAGGGGPVATARHAVSNALAGFGLEPWMASMLAAAVGTGLALTGDRLIRKVRSRG